MLKTKLKTIINAREAVQRLAGQPLPAAVSFRVAKLINALNSELVTYEAERVKLCERYGELDKENGVYKIRQREEFDREYASLLDMSIELAVDKVSIPDTLNITAVDLINLCDFIQIEGEADV